MITIILTPEQNEIVEKAGDEPVRVVNPVSKKTYLLIREDVYLQLVATGRIRPSPHSGSPEIENATPEI